MMALVVKQITVNLIGPSEHIIDAGEDGPSNMIFYVVAGLVLLALTTLPATAANLMLRRSAGWPARVCIAVAAAVILAPVVGEFVAPLPMNQLWCQATHCR